MTEVVSGRNVHPVASIFPMMGDDELRALAADIAANGQQARVIVAWADESKSSTVLLDGRNRSRACEVLGTEPDMELFSPEFIPMDDFAPMIVSWNLHRRHLSVSQRAMIGAEYERTFAEGARARMVAGVKADAGETLPQGGGRGPRASDEAADLLGVSGRTVRDAKYVAEHDPVLAGRVRADEISVSAAAKELRERNKPAPEPEPEETEEQAEARAEDWRNGRDAMLLNALVEAFHEENLKDMNAKARKALRDVLEDALDSLKELDWSRRVQNISANIPMEDFTEEELLEFAGAVEFLYNYTKGELITRRGSAK